MTEKTDADVVIVGGGPVGLMLANELGRRHVRTILLDDKPGTSPHPQANATQARTMEHFRRLGFADAIRALGLPADYPTDIAYFTRFAKHELARFELPSSGTARDLVRRLSGSWSASELPHRCSQMYVERVLAAEAARLPAVSVRFGWRATGFEAREDGVAVQAERAADGAPARFVSSYLVGCDGPRSLVRKRLGFQYAGEAGVVRDFMGGRMHAVHLRAPAFYDLVPRRPAWMYWAFNPERRGFMAALDGRGEFVFHTQARPGEDEIGAAEAKAIFRQVLGADCAIEILGSSSWTAGFALVAERYRSGRILLAGDAVHLFTPTGGLGYNTGIEDAANLGWKLAAVVKGWGGARLLDSYEAERRPVALRNTAYARHFADSIGLAVPAPELEDETTEGEAARARAGAYLSRHARAEFDIPGVTFGARYDASEIIVPDGTMPPPDQPNVYQPSACPGGRAPHLWLDDGGSLFDRFGFEFTLLRLGSAPPDAGRLAAAAASRGIPLASLDLPAEEARDLYAADLVLIRPDQVVAWRGNAVPEDVAGLLSRVTGR